MQSDHEGKIEVRLLIFGAARDSVGSDETTLLLPEHTKSAEALEYVLTEYPTLRRFGRSLLFAVNQEYAARDLVIHDGDELAIFPPVSGGSGETPSETNERQSETLREYPPITGSLDFFEITTEALDVGAIARRVVLPQCGATVTLDGYAREWTRGRRTLHLIYDAYVPMALKELERLSSESHKRFDIAHIGIVHRIGQLEIGETSVVICVSATHRRAAFEACEWAIRELKRVVPIWKKEVFEDGEVWVEGEGQLRS